MPALPRATTHAELRDIACTEAASRTLQSKTQSAAFASRSIRNPSSEPAASTTWSKMGQSIITLQRRSTGTGSPVPSRPIPLRKSHLRRKPCTPSPEPPTLCVGDPTARHRGPASTVLSLLDASDSDDLDSLPTEPGTHFLRRTFVGDQHIHIGNRAD